MKDDTYPTDEELLKLFQKLLPCNQRKVIDYLKDLVSEPSTTSSVPASVYESTP